MMTSKFAPNFIKKLYDASVKYPEWKKNKEGK